MFGLIECAASVTLGDILAPELLGIDAVKRFLFVGSLSFDFNRSDIDKFPKARFERLLCQPPVYVASFGGDATLLVHEHKSVCAYLEFYAVGIRDSTKLLPICSIEKVLRILCDPAPKRSFPAHRLHVIAPAVPFLWLVSILRQAEFVFKHGAEL